MATREFEYFDHIADVGIRLRADSLEALFSAAADALVGWIGPPPSGAEAVSCDVEIEAEDPAGLLVRWMQEVLYRFQVDHLYFTGARFDSLGPRRLEARIDGRTWSEAEAALYQEVKAVTYHRLEVRETAGGWDATVVLDL